jgi:homoserine kinase type II
MAVYTKVSTDELSSFLNDYNIGTLVSHEGIEAGVSNTNYFVLTSKSRYVLTLFEPHRVIIEDIAFFLNYAVELYKSGVPCPETIERKDGTHYGMLNKRPAAFFTVLLEGAGCYPQMITPELCEEAGTVLAQMHLAVHAFTRTSPNRFGMHRWQTWLAEMGDRLNHIDEGLYKFAADEYTFIASHWPKDLPAGSIHADFFPDNVFAKGVEIKSQEDAQIDCGSRSGSIATGQCQHELREQEIGRNIASRQSCHSKQWRRC